MVIYRLFRPVLLAFFSLFSLISVSYAATTVSTPASLYFPKLATVMGNPHGDVTVVEFFDYHCKYCRQVPPILRSVMKKNPRIKVVFRDYPILSPASVYAAKVALAAAMQNKYLPMYNALFSTPRYFTDDQVLQLAKAVGLNMQKLNNDMFSSSVSQQLEQNSEYAEGIGIDGVPTLVVAATKDTEQLEKNIPAYVVNSPSEAELNAAIQEARVG